MLNSYAIIREIAKVEDMTYAEKFAGVMIALHLDRRHSRIAVKQSVIARKCSLTTRCVQGAVAKMVKAGIFKKIRKPRCLILIPAFAESLKTEIPSEPSERPKDAPESQDFFYESWAWRKLRYKVLKKHGGRCMLCGRTAADGAKICVDHIKPRALFPELELVESNLQVLCDDCNMGKGRWDKTDWRKKGKRA